MHTATSHSNTNTNTILKTKATLYPWIIVLMSALFLFFKFIIQVSPSVMTTPLMQHFAMNATELGNLAACYFITYLLIQIFTGPLLDRYSARLWSSMALLMMSISVAGFSYSNTIWQAYLWRMGMGMGAAFATVSYLKLSAMYFSAKDYPFVAGLLATAASIGAMLGQTPLAYGVSHYSWQETLRYCALMGFIIAVCYFLLVRDKKTPLKETPIREKTPGFAAILKCKKLWLLTFYSGFAWSPLAVFGGLWGDPFLQQAYHISNTQAASLVSLAFLGLAVGGPVFGLISSKTKQTTRCMATGLILSFLSLWYILYGPSDPILLLALSLFIFGFGTGAFMLGFSIGTAWFCSGLAATVIAIVNTGDAFFGAISEPIVGRLLDLFWHGKTHHGAHIFQTSSYQHAMAILPFYLLIAFVLLWRIHYHWKQRNI